MCLRTLDKISAALERRPAELEQERASGKKVVGYFCCNVPEELIHALDLIPIRLGKGGDDRLTELGGRYISTNNCAFVRENVGIFADHKDPYVRNLDALAVAATCVQMYRLGEVVEHYFSIKTLSLGVPRNFHTAEGVTYFARAVENFGRSLEEIAGRRLEDGRIRQSVALYESIRSSIRQLYTTVARPNPPLTWRELFNVIHAGFYLDRADYLRLLRELVTEIGSLPEIEPPSDDRPRIFLSGSIIAPEDYKLLDIIEQSGGQVVADDLCTGIRPYIDLEVNETTPAGIARAYLTRVPCASLPNLTLEGDHRLRNISHFIRSHKADGMIYHTLRYCDPFTFKSSETKRYLGPDVPFLEIHTEYASSDLEGIRTRVSAFIELLHTLKLEDRVQKPGA